MLRNDYKGVRAEQRGARFHLTVELVLCRSVC